MAHFMFYHFYHSKKTKERQTELVMRTALVMRPVVKDTHQGTVGGRRVGRRELSHAAHPPGVLCSPTVQPLHHPPALVSNA